MITLLITLLVLALVIYCVKLVIDMLPLPPVVKTLALIIVGIIALVYLLSVLGIAVPMGRLPLLR